MRMTRAALRAQSQAEEYPETPACTEKEQEIAVSNSIPLIHEDCADTALEATGKPAADTLAPDTHSVRLALRDITDENYPKADSNIELQIESPVELLRENAVPEAHKSSKKPKGKAKGRTRKKVEAPVVVESEDEQLEQSEKPEQEQPFDEGPVTEQEQPEEPTQLQTESADTGQNPDTADQPLFLDHSTAADEALVDCSLSKTPRFDPTIHITEDSANTATEDSFVRSITSRSPAKFNQSNSEENALSISFTSSLRAHTPPLRRTSSTSFEESFEAMDALEDTIEQLTAGLPILQAEEMQSPESPIRIIEKAPLHTNLGSVTPNRPSARTPRSTSSRLQSVLRANDKENTPPVSRTPLSTNKTPLKSRTPATKPSSPLKSKTPVAKPATTKKTVAPVTKKPIATATVVRADRTKKVASAAQQDKSARRSVVISSAPRSEVVSKKPITSLNRNLSQKRPAVNAATTARPDPRRPVTTMSSTVSQPRKTSHQSSMSFSNSPAKRNSQQALGTHQRNTTSSGVLSTSKPGFVPAKSSKTPTVSTFRLPSEEIADRLKAQKEARALREPVAQKATLAEQKAAKLKADREARAERVRLNQLKAKEEEERKRSGQNNAGKVLSVQEARAEAAERGRLASKEWADKMLKKKQAGAAAAKEVIAA